MTARPELSSTQQCYKTWDRGVARALHVLPGPYQEGRWVRPEDGSPTESHSKGHTELGLLP